MIKKKNQTIYITLSKQEDVIAEVKPPIIVEKGDTYMLEPVEGGYRANGICVHEYIKDLGNGLISINRRLTNESLGERKIRIVFEAETKFQPEKYLIPCVSYNGNDFGEGKEPKGLICDGEVWMHAYDRVSIPAMTISENKDIVFAVFTSDCDENSIQACCGMWPNGNNLNHRIMWPVNELPYTYSDNDKMTEALVNEIILTAGTSFEVSFYLFVGTPMWENFGFATVFERVYKIFNNSIGPCRTNHELWELGIEYLHSLVECYKGDKLISNGKKPDSAGVIKNTPLYEIGWCGQNALSCRMFLVEHYKCGDEQFLQDALEILDNWVAKQDDNGLILAHYEWYKNGKEWNYVPKDPNKSWASNVDWINGWLPEVCNLGWAASELIQIWDLLKTHGILKQNYFDFAIKICDFFVEHYSEEYAFGKGWDFSGNCVEKNGTIGGFISVALIEAYKHTNDRKYLDCAIKSVEFYFMRDIDQFICTAGAIDCTCVDKETSAPFIRAAIDLYEISGDGLYLEKAKKAAYYFLSWMFCYDVKYEDNAEFIKYGYRTVGGTSVSVQHPAIDQYGEVIVYDLLRLFEYTKEEVWRSSANMIWNNCMQCIADEDTPPVHEIKRPVGAQNEAFYHCRWGHRADCNERGHLNDWLVSWVSAYRLFVIERLENNFEGKLMKYLYKQEEML